MVFGHPAEVGDVKSSSYLPHESGVFRLAEIFSGNTHAIQFARPEYPGLPDHAGYEFCLRNSHSASLQYVGILAQVTTHRKMSIIAPHRRQALLGCALPKHKSLLLKQLQSPQIQRPALN